MKFMANVIVTSISCPPVCLKEAPQPMDENMLTTVSACGARWFLTLGDYHVFIYVPHTAYWLPSEKLLKMGWSGVTAVSTHIVAGAVTRSVTAHGDTGGSWAMDGAGRDRGFVWCMAEKPQFLY